MYLKRNDINCLKWHGFPSCPLIALLNRWNLLGTPTCLVPKHLQIRKVEHPKHNYAFQRFRRDLRSTSGQLEFIWEPKLFHTFLDLLLPPSCVAVGWTYVYIDTNIQTEREIQLKLLRSHQSALFARCVSINFISGQVKLATYYQIKAMVTIKLATY